MLKTIALSTTGLTEVDIEKVAATQTVTAASTIIASAPIVPLSSASLISQFTSTPTIGAGANGQRLQLINLGNYAITLSDYSNSGLSLGGNSIPIQPGDSLRLSYLPIVAGGYAWQIEGSAASRFFNSSRRNRLINSNIAFSQRALSFSFGGVSNEGAYTIDRFSYSAYADGGTTASATVSLQPFALGEPIVPQFPGNFIRTTFSNQGASLGPKSYHVITQPIEGVASFAGQIVTASVWLRPSSNMVGQNIGLRLYQNFGSGGSPSAFQEAFYKMVTLVAGWQQVTVTGLVPSIVGKTVGTNGDSSFGFQIQFQAGATIAQGWGGSAFPIIASGGYVDFGFPQVELGNIATPYEFISFATTQKECLRYAYRYFCNYLGITMNSLNLYSYGVIPFPVFMRVFPTLKLAYFAADSGNNGVPQVVGLAYTSANLFNGSNNWNSAGIGVKFDGVFESEL